MAFLLLHNYTDFIHFYLAVLHVQLLDKIL